jgi:ankyrin repeat protein
MICISPRTCDNRLEAWGYPLNPEFRKIFTSRLRAQVALWEEKLKLDLISSPSSVVPRQSGMDLPIDSAIDPGEVLQGTLPFVFMDSPTLGATGQEASANKRDSLGGRIPYPSMTHNLMPKDQIPPIDLSMIDIGEFSLNAFEELDAGSQPTYESSPADIDSLFSHDEHTPSAVDTMEGTQVDYVDPSLLTKPASKPASILKPDGDSGFYSMEVEKLSCHEMDFDIIEEEEVTAPLQIGHDIVDARPESPDKAYYELFDANSLIPSNGSISYPTGEQKTERRPSILHQISCGGDHMDIALGKRRTCSCGVTYIHAVCMCMIDLPDHQLLTMLGRVLNKNELDGAGNTSLHYIAAAGRKNILDYLLRSGVDSTRVNVIGQSFLHVLDASRFSDNLIKFLEPFKESGLLEQRDLHGRTVLHGILRYPILPLVYHDLVDFYGLGRAAQFAFRDNDGLDAAQHIRTIAHAQNPYASYGHVGYAQAIVVYENIANRFIVDTSEPDNAIQEMQNRLAVLRHSNPHTPNAKPNVEDCIGRNALHCLVSEPRACSLEDSQTRLAQLKEYVCFGADLNHYDCAGRTPLLACIIDAPSGTDESVTKIAVEILCRSGANVNNRDRDGNTALYHAIRKGFCDCVAILLQHGAHVNRRAANGRSYRRLAQDWLQEHLGASEQDGFDRLQKRLAVVSAIVAYRAALEPSELQARGVDAT